jgi:hypothetical protein
VLREKAASIGKTIYDVSQLIDCKKSLKSPKTSKAGARYKNCTKVFDVHERLMDQRMA